MIFIHKGSGKCSFVNFTLLSTIFYFKCVCSRTNLLIPDFLGCGHPGVLVNGEILPEKDFYSEGDIITFACKRPFALLGNSESVCLENRTWDTPMPSCGINSAVGRTPQCLRTNQDFGEKISLDSAVDGVISSCQAVFIEKKPLELLSYFGRNHNITHVDIYMKDQSNYPVTIKVDIIYDFPIIFSHESCHLQNKRDKGNAINVRRFKCVTLQKYGVGIRIILDALPNSPVILCDIMAISVSERKCNQPEEILDCPSIKRAPENTVEYTSKYGLSSVSVRHCVNGKWIGEISMCPKSKRMQADCATPEIPTNGKLSVSQTLYAHGQQVTIICDDDSILDGPKQITCLDGTWDNMTSFCDKNLMYKRHLWKRDSGKEFYPCFEELTDGKPSSCGIYHLVNGTTTFNVYFLEVQTVNTVRFLIDWVQKRNRNPDLKISIDVRNQTTYWNKFIHCHTLIVTEETFSNPIEIRCDGTNTFFGDTITFHLNNLEPALPLIIYLCELQVLTIKRRPKILKRDCKRIEKSPNCITRQMTDVSGNQYLFYFPKPNYRLIGDSKRRCENGHWASSRPSCIEMITIGPLKKTVDRISKEHSNDIRQLQYSIMSASFLLGFITFSLFFFFNTHLYLTNKRKRSDEIWHKGKVYVQH